jgi:hypothetical protein
VIRKIIFTITLAFAFGDISGQNISTTTVDSSLQAARMSGVCKAWGLVKYYQPNVARRKIAWDAAFISSYDSIKKAYTFLSFNDQLKKLIQKSGLFPRRFSEKDLDKTKWILNRELSKLDNFKILNDTANYIHQPDFSWIYDDTIFSKENQNLLLQIIIDYKPVAIKYLKGSETIFHEENPFDNIDSLTEPYRMLGLFRYWNIVNYFFPYKNLTDKNWDSVLVENIPKFMKDDSYYSYFYKVLHLTTEINDSHAGGTTIVSKVRRNKESPRSHTYYYPPFRVALLDSSAVIKEILNDSLEKLGTIQKGDIVIKVNNKTTEKALRYFRDYSPNSTAQSFTDDVNQSLTSHFADTCSYNITLVRQNDTLIVYGIKGLTADGFWNDKEEKSNMYYIIQDSIGYINLDKVKVRDIRKSYRKYKNLPVIIFDMRGYPSSLASFFLPKMLSRKPVPVANYYYPDKKYAGVFIKNKVPESYYCENLFLMYVKGVFGTGKKIFPTFNKIYSGKVIVLIDEQTVSAAETVCMILKAYAKNATFIGRPTEGANGDVIDFFLPGGIKVNFSSLDWHFPNGTQLQRIGILPDIKVERTIDSIKKGSDEILERAVFFAHTHN